MTGPDRIKQVDNDTHLPTNVHPITERPARRATPRWLEWSRENQQTKDLTGRITRGAA